MLNDTRDSLADNVIIPVRPPRPNDNGDDNGDDNDDGDDNGDDKTSYIDLSWINDLQLYEKIASEVLVRYNEDKNSFELFTLRTFIDNINNERDAREEFKTVKKNVQSEALKQIVKKLEQAIFGYDGDKDDDKDKEKLESSELSKKAEELDKRFKNLTSKKGFESLEEAEELEKKFKNLISKKCLESFKEYLKKAEYINPQSRVNALRKKLNSLPETSSDETSDETSDEASDETSDGNNDNYDNNHNNNNNDNDDSEDNQISNFVDRVLKKVSKEIVNDHKKDDSDNKNDDNKKLLKLSKEYNAKEAQRASEKVEKFNKMINDNLDMSREKSEIINKLLELYSLRQIYYLNKIDNNL